MTFVFVALAVAGLGALVYFGFVRKAKTSAAPAAVTPASPREPVSPTKPQ